MMKRHALIMLLICAGLFIFSCSDDNPVTPKSTGIISGRVTLDGIGASGVIVEARPYTLTEGNPKPGDAQQGTSVAAAGDYRLELVPGSYRVYFSQSDLYGDPSTSRYPIEVRAGETTVLDVELKEHRAVNLIAREIDARVRLTFEGAYDAERIICYRTPAELDQFEPIDTTTNSERRFFDSPPAIGAFKYRVAAVGDSGETAPEEVTIAFSGLPEAPRELQAVPQPTYFYLQWSVSYAHTSNVYRSRDGENWVRIMSRRTSYYRDTLSELGTYYYRVSATSQYDLESPSTPAARVEFTGAYGPPTEVTAADMGSYIRVEWQRFAADASYNVYRALGSAGDFARVATVEEGFFIDRPEEHGLYRYRITAFGPDSVESAWSMETSAEFDGHLDVPQELRADVRGVALEIFWNGVANAYRYAMYRSADNGESYLWLGDSGHWGFDDEPPAAGDYLYAVTSVTDDGVESEKSAPVAVFYPDTLGTPGPVIATSQGRRIKITWTGTSDADGYRIFRSDEANGEYAMIQEYTSGYDYYDSPDTVGYYFYKVRAFTLRGHLSPFSQVGYTYFTGLPEPPNFYSIIDCGYNVYLNWEDDYQEQTAIYVIYRATAAGGDYSPIDSTNGSSLEDWLVEAGEYYYKIRTKQDGYYSDYTPYRWVHFSARLNPPRILSCTDEGAIVFLRWDYVGGANSYNIFRGTDPGSLTLIGEVLYTSVYDTPPGAGRYYYAVSAETRGGLESPLSTPAGVDFTP